MRAVTHETVSDYTECPHCVTEATRLGGGTGYADRYFNLDGGLWASCSVHAVRWYVTRELFVASIPDMSRRRATFEAMPVVEGVFRHPERTG